MSASKRFVVEVTAQVGSMIVEAKDSDEAEKKVQAWIQREPQIQSKRDQPYESGFREQLEHYEEAVTPMEVK
jgi:hypothetical protein